MCSVYTSFKLHLCAHLRRQVSSPSNAGSVKSLLLSSQESSKPALQAYSASYRSLKAHVWLRGYVCMGEHPRFLPTAPSSSIFYLLIPFYVFVISVTQLSTWFWVLYIFCLSQPLYRIFIDIGLNDNNSIYWVIVICQLWC